MVHRADGRAYAIGRPSGDQRGALPRRSRTPEHQRLLRYNLGGWRMYSLNTNCDRINCDAELEWLRRDLAANPRRCSLVAMHHPRFSSGVHGDSREAGVFWPVLDARQVDVVLAGHDHDYERFTPMSAGGTPSTQGIRSWVVGTGGQGAASVREPAHRLARPQQRPGGRALHDAAGAGLLVGIPDGRRGAARLRYGELRGVTPRVRGRSVRRVSAVAPCSQHPQDDPATLIKDPRAPDRS